MPEPGSGARINPAHQTGRRLPHEGPASAQPASVSSDRGCPARPRQAASLRARHSSCFNPRPLIAALHPGAKTAGRPFAHAAAAQHAGPPTAPHLESLPPAGAGHLRAVKERPMARRHRPPGTACAMVQLAAGTVARRNAGKAWKEKGTGRQPLHPAGRSQGLVPPRNLGAATHFRPSDLASVGALMTRGHRSPIKGHRQLRQHGKRMPSPTSRRLPRGRLHSGDNADLLGWTEPAPVVISRRQAQPAGCGPVAPSRGKPSQPPAGDPVPAGPAFPSSMTSDLALPCQAGKPCHLHHEVLPMSFTVTVQPAGRVFGQRDETLLAAAMKAQVGLPYGCKDGACGSCSASWSKARVIHRPSGQGPERSRGSRRLRADLLRHAADRRGAESLFPGHGEGQFPSRSCCRRVMEIHRPAADVAILKVQLPANDNFQYHAGQYVEFLLRDGSRRAYSIASAPSNWANHPRSSCTSATCPAASSPTTSSAP